MGYLTLLVTVFIALCRPAFSAERIPFSQILESTLQKNAQIQEAVADIEIARAQLGRANAALFPTGKILAIGGPIWEESGNPVSTTTNFKNWGPFLSATLELAQPLYTFGQISSYRDAARSQIAANQELAEMKKAEVLLTTKEFFYGYLMASDLQDLVKDLVVYLDEAVKKAEETKGKQKNPIKPHDIYNLKTQLEDLRQKLLLADRSRRTAERAVGWISAMQFKSLGERRFEPEKFTLKTLEQYIEIARNHRPEFKALTAGQSARHSLSAAKRAQSYPIFFVGAYLTAPWSPVRTPQSSIYAFDPFNRIMGGVGLGIKIDLEFARHSAEAAEQTAEALKLKAKEDYATPGIELEVKKAFWEVEEAIESLEIATRRKNIAQKWFASNAAGWSIGISPPKELMEALEGKGMAKKNYIETIYALNMSLARLTKATGIEVTDLKYQH